MNIWITELVTVPVGELVCYWVLLVTLGIIASLGWSNFVRLKKRKSVFTCPFINISKDQPIVNNPSDNVQNEDEAGKPVVSSETNKRENPRDNH
jgi:hypothetical protein